ncbi:MAG: T9SS type A sorting domain-containing protein [Bacteroidetes bacterium]|nr:T9SS type A sorting domain-containing protein [Bacteroidota bacterium]
MKKITLLATLIGLFISTTNLIAQIPNGTFESWAVDIYGDNNPVSWTTTNSDPDISVTPYSPAYAGTYSMKVSTFDPGFMAIPGIADVSFPYSQRPTQINACFKANILPGDKAYIIVALYQGDSIVAAPGDCSFVIDTTISTFTCMSFPITYQSALIPDSAYIMIVAGSSFAQLGTNIIVDNLTFSLPADIATYSNNQNKITSYPNPTSAETYIDLNLNSKNNIVISVWDAKGALVNTINVGAIAAGKEQITLNTNTLENGIYTYHVKGEDISYYGKLIVNK